MVVYKVKWLNPIENEAVVQQVLNHFKDVVSLFEFTSSIKEPKDFTVCKGVNSWRVFSRDKKDPTKLTEQKVLVSNKKFSFEETARIISDHGQNYFVAILRIEKELPVKMKKGRIYKYGPTRVGKKRKSSERMLQGL